MSKNGYGTWGAMSMIYDESRNMSGISRSNYILQRCRECGIKPPAKHVTDVAFHNFANRPSVPAPTSTAPISSFNSAFGYAAGAAAIIGLGYLLVKWLRKR